MSKARIPCPLVQLDTPCKIKELRKRVDLSYWFSYTSDVNNFTKLNSLFQSTIFLPLNTNTPGVAPIVGPGSIRVTLWISDGTVFYDNYNGYNSTVLSLNYDNNNHGTRLEGQLAIVKKNGNVIRQSSTTIDKFHYVAKWYYDKTTKENVCVRLALQI